MFVRRLSSLWASMRYCRVRRPPFDAADRANKFSNEIGMLRARPVRPVDEAYVIGDDSVQNVPIYDDWRLRNLAMCRIR